MRSALRVLKANRMEAHDIDLSDIAAASHAINAAWPDLIAGGPPCQDFSSSGKKIEGANAALTPTFAMTICVSRPEWFVFENVGGAARSEAYKTARRYWVRAGYGLTEMVLRASDYGVPQRRKRFICIGRLGERDGFLESALLAARSKTEMTLRDAFGDELGDAIYVHPRVTSEGDKRRLWSVDRPAPTVRSTYSRPMPADYQPNAKDAVALELTGDLTMSQVARIQGFPADHSFEGLTKTDASIVIANAVPPPLARVIGEAILARAGGYSIPDLDAGFEEFLAARGKKPRTIANIRSQVNRARKLLHGRTYSDRRTELADLEEHPTFVQLIESARSDLRKALTLYAEMPRAPSPYTSVNKMPNFGRRPSA
ncbi:hypothetical protein ASF70_12770 [Rhizobium sp. Leaf321]|nr:hypothetical protein ASF70_12770 [Rhizobium sp. Leaf321]